VQEIHAQAKSINSHVAAMALQNNDTVVTLSNHHSSA